MQGPEIVAQVEKDFSIDMPLASMQNGLSAYCNFSDYIYVTEQNLSKLNGQDLSSLIYNIASLCQKQNDIDFQNNQLSMEQIPSQTIIMSLDTQTWKKLAKDQNSKYQVYKPWQKTQKTIKLPENKKNFYKFNIRILIQVKKIKRDQGKGKFRKRNQVTLKVLNVLNEYKPLGYQIIEGQSRQFCGVKNAIIAGYFNDNIEKPKDPYTFFLNTLIGYDRPSQLGGTYLLAQKCMLNWTRIHQNVQKLPEVIGRNQIKTNSSIFSQLHCPFSHIKNSRIKDDDGNPVILYRQSKSFTTEKFDQVLHESQTDYIRPEEGIFFLGYHKDQQLLQKMMLAQLGGSEKCPVKFNDQLLNYFHVTDGNILYVPSQLEIAKFVQCSQKKNIKKQKSSDEKLSLKSVFSKILQISKQGVASISRSHRTRWLQTYHKHKMQEKKRQTTCNNYYLYSRAQFMTKMSYAQRDEPQLNPPSPRIMRLLSKTFALWQDTWYYDRRQKQFNNLQYYILKHPQVIQNLKKQSGYEGIISAEDALYKKIPIVIRNGLAIYFILSHVVSTQQYGCRGPVKGDPKQIFGANTFHLQPEDLLAGGQANLTFGQGKHLIQYFTEDQLKNNWISGLNLSAHSGIGHVNPHVEYIIKYGLQKLTSQFKSKADKFKENNNPEKQNLFRGSVFSLLGMKKYFQNYAELALKKAKNTLSSLEASKLSYMKIHQIMKKLSTSAPSDLQQGAQLVLSVFICLHLTGQPVSLGRLDHSLRQWATKKQNPDQTEQDIIDCFWIKVGQKANFNKTFFEDHQKFGNLAFGGNSAPYPQGASFNQWGHQLTVGGTQFIKNPKVQLKPFYNSVTVSCLRAARRIPVNAPCLGLRVRPDTPQYVLEQAAKTILSGGAHPIILNDKKIIDGFLRSGSYKIDQKRWDDMQVNINGKKTKDVPFCHWNPNFKLEDACNFGSDGCYQFLPIGKSWFWLGGGCALQPLEYVINVGKSLINSGPRYIHGKRQYYRWKELSEYKDYQSFEKQYFSVFQQYFRKGFFFELSGFENLTQYCPATLLNAFTADMIQRQSDFYTNGANYKLFCPQYTGVANLVNSLWNIRELVYEKKIIKLQQVRNALLVNWGDQLEEPFVSRTLPIKNIQQIAVKMKELRKTVWNQRKFGIDRDVTVFGLRIMRQMSNITRKIFEQPNDKMLELFKTLTGKYGSKESPFGFQYLPGCGTFQNFADVGADIGASFDGRKKAQPTAQDLTCQNFLFDIEPKNPEYKWNDSYLEDILKSYNYYEKDPLDKKHDPQFLSGAVLDLNIEQDYDMSTLKYNITQFAQGEGPNVITITVANRPMMQQLRNNMDRDLMRFRQGGWSQFGISMFPHILEHHIRRKRSIAKPVIQTQIITQNK